MVTEACPTSSSKSSSYIDQVTWNIACNSAVLVDLLVRIATSILHCPGVSTLLFTFLGFREPWNRWTRRILPWANSVQKWTTRWLLAVHTLYLINQPLTSLFDLQPKFYWTIATYTNRRRWMNSVSYDTIPYITLLLTPNDYNPVIPYPPWSIPLSYPSFPATHHCGFHRRAYSWHPRRIIR